MPHRTFLKSDVSVRPHHLQLVEFPGAYGLHPAALVGRWPPLGASAG